MRLLNKKAQDLPIKTIIIVVIAVVVLAVVLIGVFSGFGKTTGAERIWWNTSANLINNSSAEAAQAISGS